MVGGTTPVVMTEAELDALGEGLDDAQLDALLDRCIEPLEPGRWAGFWAALAIGAVLLAIVAANPDPWMALEAGALMILVDAPLRLRRRARELRSASGPPRGAILVVPADPPAESMLRDVPRGLVFVGVFVAIGVAGQAVLDMGGGAWTGLGLAVGAAISHTTIATLERRALARGEGRGLARRMFGGDPDDVVYYDATAHEALGR